MSVLPSAPALAGHPAAAARPGGEVAVMGANPRWSSRDGSSGARFLNRTPAELAAMAEDALLNRLRWIRALMAPDAGGMTFDRSRERAIALREKRQLEDELVRRNEQPTRRKDP
jgi:hypothetical protein